MSARDRILDPSGGGDYLYCDGPLYSYFLGGNTNGTPNILRWKSGRVHKPDPTQRRFWGLGNTVSAAIDIPVDHRPYGGDTVLVDGLIHYMPGSMRASPYCTYAGNGRFRVEIMTHSSTFPTTAVTDFYVGCEDALLTADFVLGERRQESEHLNGLTSIGDTFAGLFPGGGALGGGIWFQANEASTVDGGLNAKVVYIYTGSASIYPDEFYGGIGIAAYMNSGSSDKGSPRYSPFVVRRNATAANDPSGTRVRGGFTTVGMPLCHFGSPSNVNTTASRPISDVVYSGFTALGGQNALMLGSQQTGSTIAARYDSGFKMDNMKRGDKFVPRWDVPGSAYTSDGTEQASFEFRSRVEIDGGTGLAGIGHGMINVAMDVTSMTGVEEELVLGFIRSFHGTAVGNAGDCRGLTIRNARNFEATDSSFSLFPTASHLGGYGTKVARVAWRGTQDNYGNPDDSQELVNFFNGDFNNALTTVMMRDCHLSRVGDEARGVQKPWGVICLKNGAGRDIPANMIDIQRCVLLTDPGRAIFRSRRQGGTGLSFVQTFKDNFDNYSGGDGLNAIYAEGGNGIGTKLSYASLFVGGSFSGNQTDTAANISKRTDRPARQAGGRLELTR